MKFCLAFAFSALFLMGATYTYQSHAEEASWGPEDQANWWRGEQYNQNSTLQQRWAYGFLGHHEFIGDEEVLDIGCRDGHITSTIARAVPLGRVVGVDASPSMIDFACEHFDVHNLSFQLMDLTALPFQEEFDLAVSFNSLLWVRDQPAALQGIYQALRSGGEAKIVIPIKAPQAFTESVDTLAASKEWAPFFEGFVPSWRHQKGWGDVEAWRNEPVSGYRHLLIDAGFTPQRVESIVHADAFPDKETFLGFVNVITPHLRRLPEALKDDFMEQWYQMYTKSVPPDAEGNLWWHATTLEIEASK